MTLDPEAEVGADLAGLSPDGFSLNRKVAVVTGATGVLGGAMAAGLARAGAAVALIGRRAEVAEARAEELRRSGATAVAAPADVTDRASVEAAREQIEERLGGVDILVNAAGGNHPGAMVHGEQTFDRLARSAFDEVVELNLTGTLLPTQVFAPQMARRGAGSVINVSSMAAQQAITRVLGYSVAKAGVDNLTRWLAMEMARTHGDRLRVNAIAPGFFVGEQNRHLLLEPDGSLTERGSQIVANTPAGRFGKPDEVVGAVVWLAGDQSRFVTGAVIPIDGGFSVFSGV
jgi:NAD(P)-dependent dehydrogenase (short-subunit alcohol dehydrogenase family)